MRKSLSLSLLFGLVLALLGCQQPDPISAPSKKDPEEAKTGTLVTATVDIPTENLTVDQIIRLAPKLITNGAIDTSKVKFTWSITENGVPIQLADAAQRILDWVPGKAGKYAAHVTISYGDKTVEIYVLLIITGGMDDTSRLALIRYGMNGRWTGTVTTPWVAPYPVEVEFRSDGTYSARNLEAGNPQPALYYGTDEDSPFKTFRLDDMQSNGEATGEITVYFHVGTTVVDELRHVRLGPGAKTLSLEMWHFGTYGPVRMELTRTP